jgi:hypothetical protein
VGGDFEVMSGLAVVIGGVVVELVLALGDHCRSFPSASRATHAGGSSETAANPRETARSDKNSHALAMYREYVLASRSPLQFLSMMWCGRIMHGPRARYRGRKVLRQLSHIL